MEEILKELNISEHTDIHNGVEVSIPDSNQFGIYYTKLEQLYDADEEKSTVDSIVFPTDKFTINLIADYPNNKYTLRIIKN